MKTPFLMLLGIFSFFSQLQAKDLWSDPAFYLPPASEPATPVEQNIPEGIYPLFLPGPTWQGKPTKIFAYFGLPPNASAEHPVPALVLVHGGGGSAFIPWVKLWNSRGYAAIAIDTCGQISGGGFGNHPRHEWAGPPGWGGFDQLDLDPKDQWTYHAVAATLIGHSYLLSRPEIDKSRTGLTGISWGAVVSCIAGAVDHRFKGVVPVYGTGFLSTDSVFQNEIQNQGIERAQRWTSLWDPSSYLPEMKSPVLWVTGTNDFAFPLSALMSSAALVKSPQFFCITPRMPHGHGGPGESPPEIRTFFDSLFLQKPPLPTLIAQVDSGKSISCVLPAGLEASEITLNETSDSGSQDKRLWTAQALRADSGAGRLTATASENATAAFINVKTNGQIVSSPVFFFNKSEAKR